MVGDRAFPKSAANRGGQGNWILVFFFAASSLFSSAWFATISWWYTENSRLVKKKLEKIEKHLEQTNETTTELGTASSPNSLRFDVQLKEFGRQKVPIVKEVRALTGLGLRETKEMVESAPVIIQKRVRRENAEDAKRRLEALGAVVEIVQTQLV